MCIQKLTHVTFSFAFSSRYAKTRTSNFRKVVWQHTEGMVESIIWIFVGNLPLFPAVKEFWKSVKNWQSYRHEFGVLLFWDTVYNESMTSVQSSTDSEKLTIIRCMRTAQLSVSSTAIKLRRRLHWPCCWPATHSQSRYPHCPIGLHQSYSSHTETIYSSVQGLF